MSIQTARELNLIIGLKMGFIPKKILYIGASEPSNKNEGKLWFDKSSNKLFSSDGIEYEEVGVDLKDVNKLIGLNGLNILDIIAQSSLTAGTNANFYRDIFTDSNGYLNTIDTGNTTAGFVTNKYTNGSAGNQLFTPTDLTSATSHSPYVASESRYYSTTYYAGWRCFSSEGDNQNFGSGSNVGDWIKIDLGSGNSEVATKLIIKNHSSDNTRVVPSYKLEASNDNSNWTDLTGNLTPSDNNAGTETTHTFSNSTAYRYYRVVVVSNPSSGQNGGFNRIKIYEDTAPQNLIVQINSQTINSGATKFMIVSHESTAGSGSVKYDVSFDGGTNFQTDLDSFTEYDITDTGTSLIVKQKLNGVGVGNTSEAEDLGVLYW